MESSEGTGESSGTGEGIAGGADIRRGALHVEAMKLQKILEAQEVALAELHGLVELQRQELARLRLLTGSAAPPRSSAGLCRDCGLPSSAERKDADALLHASLVTRHTPAGGKTVARRESLWEDYFTFLSAVKVDEDVACLQVLPQEGGDGLSRYVAIGDVSGKLYIFSPHGDLLLEHRTASRHAITAMLSLTLRRNETWLVTGHADGAILVHQLSETPQGEASLREGSPGLSLRLLQALVLPHGGAQGHSSVESQFESVSHVSEQGQERAAAADGLRMPLPAISSLELYRSGNSRYILVTDLGGTIRLFRSNGTLYGAAQSPSRPLAFLRTPSSQRLLFLTATGAGSLDLRSMEVRNSHCEGLNDSTVEAYAFDTGGRSRAYGVTAQGELIYVALTGDTFSFDCHVHMKKSAAVRGPAVPFGVKGYLLVASSLEVTVWNATGQGSLFGSSGHFKGLRHVLSAPMEHIASLFGQSLQPPPSPPLIVSNRDRLLILCFANGFVAMFRSNLPVSRPPDFNPKMWSSPVLMGLIVLVGAWQFFSNRRGPPSVEPPTPPLGLTQEFSHAFRQFDDKPRLLSDSLLPEGRGRNSRPAAGLYGSGERRRGAALERPESAPRLALERSLSGLELSASLERQQASEGGGSAAAMGTYPPPSRRQTGYGGGNYG